jgi:pentatricopeptide repeat protein
VVDGQRQRPEPAPFMDAVAATQGLTDARIAARVGNVDDACDFYERMRTSGLAKLAALEEAQLLLRERRPLDALTAIGSLPPELMTDAVRVEHGRALLATGHPDQAFATLSRIGGKAPESRAALLLIGRCYRAQGKPDEARKVFEFLAKGGDEVASEAGAELGRAGR